MANYIAAWKALLESTGSFGDRDVQRALFAHLYENLNILDAKTNSLIQLNGIIIASYVFVISISALRLPRSAVPMLLLGLAYAAAAVFLCLRVIWVHWSSRADLRHADAHIKGLIRIRTQRTIEFRRAWTFCCASICTLVVIIANYYIEKWNFDLSPLIPLILVGHFFLIYVYDDILIAASHRNLGLRISRIGSALRGGNFGWRVRVIGRALQTRSHWRSSQALLGLHVPSRRKHAAARQREQPDVPR